MKKAYFWPVYGELDEICFPFFPSREIKHVEAALGLTPAERAVLLSDGYHAYAHYATRGRTSSCVTSRHLGVSQTLFAHP
ncbi:MAG: transposase [Candidatus Accumulibacter sp.]|nr:transposase [Accumulibacter sp.]